MNTVLAYIFTVTFALALAAPPFYLDIDYPSINDYDGFNFVGLDGNDQVIEEHPDAGPIYQIEINEEVPVVPVAVEVNINLIDEINANTPMGDIYGYNVQRESAPDGEVIVVVMGEIDDSDNDQIETRESGFQFNLNSDLTTTENRNFPSLLSSREGGTNSSSDDGDDDNFADDENSNVDDSNENDSSAETVSDGDEQNFEGYESDSDEAASTNDADDNTTDSQNNVVCPYRYTYFEDLKRCLLLPRI